MTGCGFLKLFSIKKQTATTGSLATQDNIALQAQSQHSTAQKTSLQSTDSPQNDATSHYQNGKRQQQSRDDAAFLVPVNDAESNRVHKQHWLFKLIDGRNYGAPVEEELENGVNVHDAGCGPGTWAIEMANVYRKSNIYGTDVMNGFSEATTPSNCQFKVLNVAEPGHFPENYFGYVHQRSLVSCIAASDWEKVIQEHVRTLAPGGWLESVEPRIGLTAEKASPKTKLLINTLLDIFGSKGLYGRIDEDLVDLFERAGLVNVHLYTFEFPLGDETHFGNLAWEDMCDLLKPLEPLFATQFPEESFKRVLDECRAECIANRSVLIMGRFYGQKPPSSENTQS